jgi:hypothetical protein
MKTTKSLGFPKPKLEQRQAYSQIQITKYEKQKHNTCKTIIQQNFIAIIE